MHTFSTKEQADWHLPVVVGISQPVSSPVDPPHILLYCTILITSSKMECAICFEEKIRFKILPCTHTFCEKCIANLANRNVSSPIASNLKSSSSSNDDQISNGDRENSAQIECPECRQVTKLDTKLPNKYYGLFLCTQCDESKRVDEFRWCYVCTKSICSRCYLEKHVIVSSDDINLGYHPSEKWDSNFPAVRFCLQQMKKEIANGRESASKSKEYVRSYLEGLQEFISLEIDQKTKSTEIDYQKIITILSDEFSIDPKSIPIASDSNRSYQAMIRPLFEICGKKSISPILQEQKYKINSVPYKDLAGVLLSMEKTILNGPRSFFDPLYLSKKLKEESIVIGSNVIKQPSDICLLPSEESTKIIMITDFDSGIYLFKYPTMQLQGPIPLKHGYARFAKIAPLGNIDSGNSKGLSDPTFKSTLNKTSTVMVTCQVHPNSPWSFILINISPDGSKFEQIKQNNNYHFVLPKNENFHIVSSQRSLFGLSTNSAQMLWRFNGPVDLQWKEIYTVAPESKSKPYCRIGLVSDYSDHTEIMITNGAWQTIDIIKFGWPDDKLWSVKRIELNCVLGNLSNSSVNFSEPILFPCYGTGSERSVLIDKKQPIVHIFDWSTRQTFELARFSTKLPLKIVFVQANCVLAIFQHKDNQHARSLEMF